MHAHLDKLEEGPEAAIAAALAQNVRRIVTIATDPNDLKTVLEFSDKYGPHVYCTLGIHPHEGVTYTPDVRAFIKSNAHHPRVIAIGEIGLDYYYLQSPKKEQLFAFREQIELAYELGLPIEIHTRDAEQDTIDILKEYQGKVKGIIHCFTGTQWLADQALALGYNISISGIVTFKNAADLRKVVESIPVDRIHVETDAPFLAPVPMRGKSNTPSYVVHTAKFVADLKKISIEDLCLQTNKNAEKMFPKLLN
ncbi:MAG: TatD family hydrolase [Bdellovibrionaceae bacterium]|nr:TatD family hydrolase [Pseudobdellovibrionaceae bacterium]